MHYRIKKRQIALQDWRYILLSLLIPPILVLFFIGVKILIPELELSQYQQTVSKISSESMPIISSDSSNCEWPKPEVLLAGIDNQLSIPAINLKVEIFSGLDKSDLDKGAWLLPWTALPGKVGNSVITGHLLNWFSDQRPFFHLAKLENNSQIFVFWQGRKYKYKVIENKVVFDTDLSIESQLTGETKLTLYTCEGLNSNLRRVIVAQPDPNCYNQSI